MTVKNKIKLKILLYLLKLNKIFRKIFSKNKTIPAPAGITPVQLKNAKYINKYSGKRRFTKAPKVNVKEKRKNESNYFNP